MTSDRVESEGGNGAAREEAASIGRDRADNPEVTAAEDALRRAKEEWERAQAYYQTVRRRAVEEIKTLRERNVGEVLEATLTYIRKHPGQGLLGAAVVGFVLGRLFRR